MYLILAEAADRVAAATARNLPPADTVWLTPAHLVTATWTHRVDPGAVSWTLSTGRFDVDEANIDAVFNRLLWLPPVGFTKTSDVEYAAMEWQAAALSALKSLGSRVVNPPCPPSLSGPSWTTAEVLRTAYRLGLPVRGVRVTVDGRRHPGHGWEGVPWRRWLGPEQAFGPTPRAREPDRSVPVGPRPVAWLQPVRDVRTCWVAANRVLGGHDGDPDLRSLAAAMGCDFVAVTVGRADRGYVICGADPLPADVSAPAAQALADLLMSRAGS